MWYVERVQTRAVEFDFGGAALGRHRDRELLADGQLIANMLGRSSAEEAGAFQTTVCDCCGHQGCSSGAWMAVRRLGQATVWVPDLRAFDAEPWVSAQYEVPYVFRKRGCPLFRGNALLGLLEMAPHLAAGQETVLMSIGDMVRVLATSAPFGVAEVVSGKVELNLDALLVVDPEPGVSIHSGIRQIFDSIDQSSPIEVVEGGVDVTLYFDLKERDTWCPVVVHPSFGLLPRIGPRLGAVPVAGA
jgi:hypothetical protein